MNTLDRTALSRLVPSAFAEHAATDVSQQYRFIPTTKVMDLLESQGWSAVNASQARTVKVERAGFQRHLIRFRHKDANLTRVGDSVTEIVLVNSHDRTTAYQLHAGLFRLVCSNGLVVPDSVFSRISIRHTGFDQKDVIEASYRILDEIPRIADSVGMMKAMSLSPCDRLELPDQAIKLRWAESATPVAPRDLLLRRRSEDSAPDLWSTFNVIQENLIKGGLHGRCASGRRSRTRAISSLQEQVRINKELWQLALGFVPAETAAVAA